MATFGGKSISQRRDKKQAEEPSEPVIDPAFETVLANHVETAWERNKRAKLKVEQRGLRAQRQRQHQYEADVWAAIQSQGGSEHYDGLTTTKCRAAESWILDVLAPTGDRPWDLSPTPVPDISPETAEQIRESAMSAAVQEALSAEQMMGQHIGIEGMTAVMQMVAKEMEKTYKQEAEKAAKEKARNMADKVSDQFKEGGFHTELFKVVRDFVTMPACFMMGPVFRRRKVAKWKNVGGQWIPQVGQEVVQEYEWVSFFDVYPEDDATDVNDGDIFVRRRISAKELLSFRGVPGYDDQAIDEVIAAYGNGGYRNWTAIDSQRAHAEGRSNHEYESTKIDTLRFWGSVQGQWLIDHAFERGTGLNTEAIDPSDFYEIDVIKIGRYIIRAIVNPDKLGRRPLSKASYEEVPGAFWGNGVPDLIADDQTACNVMARSVINNTALSAGPIYERNVDRTQGDDGRLYPLKEFRATEDQMASGAPAVRFYNVANNTQQMLEVWEQFMRRADENSGVPAYAHGSDDVGGAGNTASGLSMLMSSSSKLLRMAIYNLDTGVIEPMVTRTYNHNMLFSKDESIKGDLNVVPKGATVLLIREQMAMRQGEFANSTANPIDYALMTPEGRLTLRKNQARNLDLDVDGIYPKDIDELQLTEPAQESGGGAGAPPGAGPGGPVMGKSGPTMDKPATLNKAGQPMSDAQQ